MPPKRNRNTNKGKITAKQAEKIALRTAYSLIPKKLDYTEGTDLTVQTNAQPWLVVQPALIDYGTGNQHRAGDQVFIEKCSGFFNVSFNPTTTSRIEVRELVGFYKGSTDPADKNIADFSASTLASMLPNKMSSWDRDNFYIKHDKSYDLMPLQVYNASASATQNLPTGIWRSKRIGLTQHLYRRFRYTNTVEGSGSHGGDETEGIIGTSNNPVGWKPFIALQIRCPDQDFTGASGSNPGPYVDYKFKTLFKDMQ